MNGPRFCSPGNRGGTDRRRTGNMDMSIESGDQKDSMDIFYDITRCPFFLHAPLLREISGPRTVSLPYQLHEHLPLPRPVVVVDEDNLLPGTQHQLAAAERHRDPRPHHGGAEMGESVVVSPGL
jgi:hypothetical protein